MLHRPMTVLVVNYIASIMFQGEEIFQLLKDAVKRGVRVQIAIDSKNFSSPEVSILSKLGLYRR